MVQAVAGGERHEFGCHQAAEKRTSASRITNRCLKSKTAVCNPAIRLFKAQLEKHRS